MEGDHSDEPISDEEVFINEADLEKVLTTKAGGNAKTGHEDDHHKNALEAIARVQDVWKDRVEPQSNEEVFLNELTFGSRAK